MAPSTVPHSLRPLDPLVGDWDLEVKGPDGTPWTGGGRSTFRWHPSKAHLVQDTKIDAPDAPSSTSIIGCDAANRTFAQLYSDDRGVCRIYSMTIDARTWTLEREGEPFAQRFVARIDEDGHAIHGQWEKAEDGTEFVVDFYLTYRRVVAAEAP